VAVELVLIVVKEVEGDEMVVNGVAMGIMRAIVNKKSFMA